MNHGLLFGNPCFSQEGLNAPGSGTPVPGHGVFEPSPHKEEAEAVERPARLIEGFHGT
jgi:hypothetical protein